MKPTRFLLLLVLSVTFLTGVVNTASAFYDPNKGRWLSRDPLEEGAMANSFQTANENDSTEDSTGAGKVNLYGFNDNDAVDWFDALGETSNKPGPKAPNNSRIHFRKCTPSQKQQILDALNESINYANEGESSLQSTKMPSATPRYVRWFGCPDQKRLTKATNNFGKIQQALTGSQITFINSGGNEYGHTVPIFKIFGLKIDLGRDFWTAPLTGQDSRAGTIVHEMSHLVAGTGDYAYGPQDSQSLAHGNPNHAVTNADSHEYYVELK